MCILTTIKYRKGIDDWFSIHCGKNFMNYKMIIYKLTVKYENGIKQSKNITSIP